MTVAKGQTMPRDVATPPAQDGLLARAAQVHSESVGVGGQPLATHPASGQIRLSIAWVWSPTARRLSHAVAALALFMLALEVLKAGASGVAPLLELVSAEGGLNIFGFGWLSAYAVMSGSPVAATGLTLFSGGVLSDIETFAMINGSRYGASFIVLFVGFLYYLRRRRDTDGLYIGAVALLTTFTLYVPSILLGLLALRQGWLDSLAFGRPAVFISMSGALRDLVVSPASALLPNVGLFILGVAMLMASFHVFDRALPQVEPEDPRLKRLLALFDRPWPMFAAGLLVTAVTLSVSVSLTLLVPLTLKGLVRRQSIIPYVMGANISTFGDTLFAATLLGLPRAVTIVLVEMVSVTAVSMVVLLLAYGPYRRLILGLADASMRSRTGFAVFLGVILLVPLLLLLL